MKESAQKMVDAQEEGFPESAADIVVPDSVDLGRLRGDRTSRVDPASAKLPFARRIAAQDGNLDNFVDRRVGAGTFDIEDGQGPVQVKVLHRPE